MTQSANEPSAPVYAAAARTDPMSVYKVAAWLPVTEQIIRDATEVREIYNEIARDVTDGPRLGPSRDDLWPIERGQRIRDDLAPGHSAGPYRRARPR